MRRTAGSRLLPCLPLLLGLVAGALLLLAQPDTRIVVEAAPALLAVVAGALLALGLLLRQRARAVAARSAQRAEAHAREQAAADRRRFLARLDHELKNPLQAVRAGLAAAGPDPALAAVDAQAARIGWLVADLRKLAEVEERPLEQEPVDLSALLRGAVTDAAELPGAERVRLRLVLPEAPRPLPTVPGDADLLMVAVDNLLANACQVQPRRKHGGGARPR